MATIGIPRRPASFTAMCSLLRSMMKSASGSRAISLIPSSDFRYLATPRLTRAQLLLRERRDPLLVFEQRELLLEALDRLLDGAEVGEHPAEPAIVDVELLRPLGFPLDRARACRLVATKSTLPPCATVSRRNSSASWKRTSVSSRLMMWMPFRSPKMKGFICGSQRRVWWPKWAPVSSSARIERVRFSAGAAASAAVASGVGGASGAGASGGARTDGSPVVSDMHRSFAVRRPLRP